MYNFNNRVSKLFTLDKIRFFKIIEIIQFSFIIFFFVIIFVILIDKFYFKYFSIKINKDYSNENKLFISFIDVLKDIIIIIILIFYLRKIALLFPSIPNLIYPKFIPYTTFEYCMHIALVLVLTELLPGLKVKLEKLKELIIDLSKYELKKK